jgi:hypothetical protein
MRCKLSGRGITGRERRRRKLSRTHGAVEDAWCATSPSEEGQERPTATTCSRCGTVSSCHPGTTSSGSTSCIFGTSSERSTAPLCGTFSDGARSSTVPHSTTVVTGTTSRGASGICGWAR